MGFKQAPYIMLEGRAAEALDFYQRVLGGEVTLTHYRDLPMEGMGGDPDWIMHGQLETEGGVTIMAADGEQPRAAENPKVVVCLYGDDRDELERLFQGLSEGGSVELPFNEAPWGSWFGQLVDAFGVTWMIEGGGEQN
ncbi:VOC family protein [Microbacterium nanhaiense]|uniref:VOC family protein n=1 Tax=Microbacterium nanhaiense TaxID=1301026 RepID=A0ABQ2N0C3_9MICO|nr:VOC family protein [Microbacterium nanhaiense]GGO63736.1 VOC family protein [Microbacterium nanhaiense]